MLVILACFVGAALASWMAVGLALRGGVRVWMDVTAKSAVKSGLWPPLVPEHSRRADLGPGLIVAYALSSGWITLLSLILVGLGTVVGQGASAVLLGLIVVPLCTISGLFLAGKALRRIEAEHRWECYPELVFHGDGVE